MPRLELTVVRMEEEKSIVPEQRHKRYASLDGYQIEPHYIVEILRNLEPQYPWYNKSVEGRRAVLRNLLVWEVPNAQV